MLKHLIYYVSIIQFVAAFSVSLNATITGKISKISYNDKVLLYATNPQNDEKTILNDFVTSESTKNDLSISLHATPIFPPIGPINPFIKLKNSFYYQKKYDKYYFSNLIDNLPLNVDGICGYTAISMLLSFYDSYWNTSIIPDIYSNNQINSIIYKNNDNTLSYTSPGIRNIIIRKSSYTSTLDDEAFKKNYEISNSSGSVSYTDAYNAMYENAIFNWIQANIDSGSFFGKLLDLATANNIIHRKQSSSDFYVMGLGVNHGIVKGILQKYIEQSPISSYANVFTREIDGADSKIEIRNDIIERLKKGQPVIVGGNSFKDLNNNGICDTDDEAKTKGGHVAIAYEYDEQNDKIYGNMGWSSRTGTLRDLPNQSLTHADLDYYFNDKISDYFGIDINDQLAHSHAKIYKNYDGSGKAKLVCSCQLQSHEHNYSYGTFDEDQHRRKCICIDVEDKSNHFYTSEIFKNGKYYAVCGGCKHCKENTNTPIPGV